MTTEDEARASLRAAQRVDAETTKDKLMSAAHELFVARGFSAVSIREIATRAQANSALINYHFGGKEGLFRQVFIAAAGPVNRRRMSLLVALEDRGSYALEDVLDAWIAPMYQHPVLQGHAPLSDLSLSLGWENSELVNQITSEVYDDVNAKFLRLLEACVPGVPRETLVWRLFFLIGAVLTATRNHERSVHNMGGSGSRDARVFVAELIAFAAAGFRAAPPR